jgi:hypothetical protein
LRADYRLSKLEKVMTPIQAPRLCVVFGDADADAVVEEFRGANDWPDDDSHPVQVIRIMWGAAKDG